MNIEQNRKELIDDLRSDKYAFGVNVLRRISPAYEVEDCEWCIGGIMCEHYRRVNADTSYWEIIDNKLYEFYSNTEEYGLQSSVLLPTRSVLDFYGITWGTMDRLSHCNDNLVRNLREMANFAESIFNEVGIQTEDKNESS